MLRHVFSSATLGLPSIVLMFLFVSACFGDYEPGNDAADTVASDSTADEGTCTPGAEGCPCIEGGRCVGDLVCASDLCVEFSGDDATSGPPSPGTDDGSSEDDGTSTTGGTPGSCLDHCGDAVADDSGGYCFCDSSCSTAGTCCADYEEVCGGGSGCTNNSECAADQVCSSSTHDCVMAYGHTYDVYLYWQGDDTVCWEDMGSCAPDPFFNVYSNGMTLASNYMQDSYNLNWMVHGVITETDTLAFCVYDWDDGTAQQLAPCGCFAQSPCAGVVGIEFLKAGKAEWNMPGEAYYLRMIFAPQ